MVKLAVAGFGEVSREIIKAVLAEGHHSVTVLSRKDAPRDILPGLNWTKIDYLDKHQLVKALKDVHTVLSFIVAQVDPGSVSQINLIDACVEVGVKRFAPSEWVMSDIDDSQMYDGKLKVRRYLENLNKPKKVLEYCMFFPGVFMNYLAPPDKLGADITYTKLFVDFEECRAILPEGPDAVVSFTTIQDVAKVVAKALDYKGEWPVMGGIAASRTSLSNLIRLGERIRGKPFSIERVKRSDLEAGSFTVSWVPKTEHPAIAVEDREMVAKQFLRFALLGVAKGAWNMSDEWNQLLPDLKLTTLEDFLLDSWRRDE